MSDNAALPAQLGVREPGSSNSLPLCVDLDGTLICTDMLWESALVLLRRNPIYAASLVAWTLKGRANLKRQISSRVSIDPSGLPYHEEFLKYLRRQRDEGRRLILVTAADWHLAEPVARHADVFSEVMASDGVLNLKGANKRAALDQRFGTRGYDYAGNSHADVAVWKGCHHAVVVNASDALTREAATVSSVELTFPGKNQSAIALLGRALRVNQWLENLLVFFPTAAAGRLDTNDLFKTAVAYIAFCFCSSSASALADLVTLDRDRRDPARKLRPFASGEISIPFALMLVAGSLVGAAATSLLLPWAVVGFLALYYLLRFGYAVFGTGVTMAGFALLASAYGVCAWSGSIATHTKPSPGMLAFGVAVCLGLAFARLRRKSR